MMPFLSFGVVWMFPKRKKKYTKSYEFSKRLGTIVGPEKSTETRWSNAQY